MQFNHIRRKFNYENIVLHCQVSGKCGCVAVHIFAELQTFEKPKSRIVSPSQNLWGERE